MKRISLGFTLLKLLTTLTIVSTLVSASLPGLSNLTANSRADTVYRQLFTLIQFTRIQAVNYGSQAILCPTVDQIHCIADWNKSLMLFVDSNNNEKREASEAINRITAAIPRGERLVWQTSGSDRYLRFKSDGTTRNQNGRLTYCLEIENKTYPRQIVMYRTGRARQGSQGEAIQQC